MEKLPATASHQDWCIWINYLAVYSTFQIARLWKKEMQIGPKYISLFIGLWPVPV